MSISQVLSATALARTYRELRDHVQALETHLKLDYEAVKADLTARVAHYEAEAARLESVVGADVAALLKRGVRAEEAVTQAAEAAKTAVEDKPNG